MLTFHWMFLAIWRHCRLAVIFTIGLLAGCNSTGHRGENIHTLKVNAIDFINRTPEKYVVQDTEFRFYLQDLEAIEYTKLEDMVSPAMADDFVGQLKGEYTCDERVYFWTPKTLRNWLFVSIKRDGTDCLTAALGWCR